MRTKSSEVFNSPNKGNSEQARAALQSKEKKINEGCIKK